MTPPNLDPAFLLNGSLLVVANFVLGQLKAFPARVWSWILRLFSVTLELPQYTHAHSEVKQLLAKQKFIFKPRNRSVIFESTPEGDSVLLLMPAPGSHWFWWNGRPACIYRSRRDLQNGGQNSIFEDLVVRFFFGNDKTILKFVETATVSPSKKKILSISSYGISGNYSIYERLPRPLETVFLADEIKENLTFDIKRFMDEESKYRRLGIPYHRGYLFEGPPGNGKSSLIKAMASYFDLTICTIPLNMNGFSDFDLIRTMNYLGKGKLILFEDIDGLFEKRDSKDSRVTFSGLLNALDGISAAEGYIFMATTNHLDRLDPALIRPGRIDKIIHVGNATSEQAALYFDNFYELDNSDLGREFGEYAANGSFSMAQIQQHLLEQPSPMLAVGSFINKVREAK